MGLRVWIFRTGAILGIGAVLLSVVSISVTLQYKTHDVACGTAVNSAEAGGFADMLASVLTPTERRLLRVVETDPLSGVSQCCEPVAKMQRACWIVGGLAVSALVGGWFVLRRPGCGDRETAPARLGDQSGRAGASKAQAGHRGKDSPVLRAGSESTVSTAEVG